MRPRLCHREINHPRRVSAGQKEGVQKVSVPSGERGESKFQLLIDARNLAVYTIRICCNPKVFLPQYQNALTNNIIHVAIAIYMNVWNANNIMVKTAEDLHERKEHQKKAVSYCNDLLALMEMAKTLFHLSSKRIKYWGGFTIEVRNGIRAWIDSDRKRFRFE